jgi:hypothetical protein
MDCIIILCGTGARRQFLRISGREMARVARMNTATDVNGYDDIDVSGYDDMDAEIDGTEQNGSVERDNLTFMRTGCRTAA